VPIAEDRRGEQIHKIMSAPILLDNRVVGVLQVSRKAAEASEAGPDFTQAQLRELVLICETIAPCVALSRRESTRHVS
jgi:transcriptional regulator with GAF, ATPase, and Fis domain